MLTQNEIRNRAIEFVRDHNDYHDEKSQDQTFLRDFFNIWGIPTSKVGTYQARAKLLNGNTGFIDFFWPGLLLVEMKSKGVDLDGALRQALDYIPNLKNIETPRFVMLSDFQTFRIYNLENQTNIEFSLRALPDNLNCFVFLIGQEVRTTRDEGPVNIKAAEMMGMLHDKLKEDGYDGHDLEVFLVRCMFMMFADDTGIWQKDHLAYYLESKTNPDGSDFGSCLVLIFQILDTPENKRQRNLDSDLSQFPYVNGSVFSESIRVPMFDKEMRKIFLSCFAFDWGKVSPAIFGSLFQAVMSGADRRALGAHYTSEVNVLKTINALFLDQLNNEFEKSKHNVPAMKKLLSQIQEIGILDPACGCGDFLILSYRELRRLENQLHMAIRKLKDITDQSLDVIEFKDLGITVENLFGIELLDFPSQIARVALWIMDHLMNTETSFILGSYRSTIPLKKTPHILCCNALEIDWESIIPKDKIKFIVGNPPFRGARLMDSTQKADLLSVFKGLKGAGNLDFVTAWYKKAANFIQGTSISVGFVSTNSISQGEQVPILWKNLIENHGIVINFAHKTFKWTNEARGVAAVFCVIIGFSQASWKEKSLYIYHDISGDAIKVKVNRINPYLIDAPTVFIEARTKPISDVPKISFGNMPIDDGNYLFGESQMLEFIDKEPASAKWFRPWIGADEFIKNKKRYCLFLANCPPNELSKMPMVLHRVQAVKNFRLKSKREPTRLLASTPTKFNMENLQDSKYIIIPEVSSEKREYIPIGFIEPEYLASNLVRVIAGATLYHFGILTSKMHMAWMRCVAGRMKSDFRYSTGIVYNNYPWPEPSEKQKKQIENLADNILKIRGQYLDCSLADLYNPLSMPGILVAAHKNLDTAVDLLYGKKFKSDEDRVAGLFDLYNLKTHNNH